VVVTSARDLDSGAKDVDEEQYEDQRLHGDIEELCRFPDDAGDAATGQHEDIPA
jgi:hypothetical protein